MTLSILWEACVAYRKNGFERNSPYVLCEKQIVLSVLKFYSVKTEWTYEQKMICIVLFWKNYRPVEVQDIWSFNFFEQCKLKPVF